MTNIKLLTDLRSSLSEAADVLDDIRKEIAEIQSRETACAFSSEILSEPPIQTTLPTAESVSDQIRARVEDIGTQERFGIEVNIPSPLHLRLHHFFNSNAEINRGSWNESCVRRHYGRCKNLNADELAAALRHTESRARARKQWFLSAELIQKVMAFTIRNKIDGNQFICSALQRELEECERINGGPFPIG